MVSEDVILIKQIILDTSSILFAISQRKDVFEALLEEYPGCEIILSKGIVMELQKLASTKKRNARDARTALLMLKHKNFTTRKSEAHVDKWILEEAMETGAAVCTNDTKLREKLRAVGVNVVSIGLGGRLR